MEKEKKVVKTKTKSSERKTNSKELIFNKEIKKVAKIIAIVFTFLAAAISIFVFVFGIITSIKVANNTKVELLHDNFSVTFISNVKGISIADAENVIQGYGSKTLFIIFNIVIPCIAIIAVAILMMIFAKKVLDFANSFSKEKDLYTKDNLVAVQKIACLIEAMISITFIFFNRPGIILYLLISLLLFIVIGLFTKCVEKK